ncbi:RNA polymerase sigma factor [Tumebacillus lipolyticus]|uniref:RNA polymerase sigma factor n=1 Tax=Tumebacillus lipolyticus TaxID=1280370 RepID=A0ABW4ZVP1_9BACL
MDEIVKRALHDANAMSDLLDELEPFVFKVSYSFTRHQQDAEDLAQDVLYKICTKLSKFRGDSSLQTWVYTLIMNSYKDSLRKKKNRKTEPLPDDTPISSFEAAADARLMFEEALKGLPETDRDILVLRFQNDLSVREVAAIMNLSESNVKTRVFRIKDRLRSLFFQGGEVL